MTIQLSDRPVQWWGIATSMLVFGLLGCATERPERASQPGVLEATSVHVTIDSTPVFLAGPTLKDGVPPSFTDVRGIFTLADGSSVFADAAVPVVYAFGPTGILQATIGRAGSGPGEFRAPQVVGVLADTVVVFDPPQRKVTLFTRTGTPLRAMSFPAGGGAVTILQVLSSDRILVKRTLFTEAPSTTALVPASGQLLDVAFSTGAIETLAQETDGLWRGYRWFTWQLVAAADDSTLWYGRGDRAELVRFDLRTRRSERWTWSATSRPVTEEDRQGARDFAALMRAPAEMTTPDRFADSVPIFGNILPDPNGPVWILSYPRPMSTPDSAWVVDVSAGTVEVVRLPPRFRPIRVLTDKLLGVFIDEDGVQVPASFGVTRATPSAPRQ